MDDKSNEDIDRTALTPRLESPIPQSDSGAELESLLGSATSSGNTARGETHDDLALPLLGARIGNYSVERLLGEGGFGSVYLAHDTKLDRKVALKFMRHPDRRQHGDMFRREAKAMARLSKHAHIVTIYEWGECFSHNYFALEYIPLNGDTLIKRHPEGLPLKLALEIGVQCAEALRFAHERGVIHRDVKPANILLESDTGPAKLGDFGLTRIVDSPDHTIAATISGSPPYMSPEQASGLPLDHRTDIYSLGVTLYQLLSGLRPVDAKSTLEMVEKIRRREIIPLHERAPHLPADVIAVVEKAMAYEPSDRYETAEELESALADLFEGLTGDTSATIRQRKLSPPLHRNLKVAGLAAVGVLVLLIVAWAATRPWLDRDSSPDQLEGDRLMAAGDFAGAQGFFERLLSAEPGNANALAGLGHALLRLGETARARESFNAIPDETLKREGLSALAFTEDPATAAGLVKTTLEPERTPYMQAMLGMAMVGDEPQAALAALQSVDADQLPFEWQRNEYLRALGAAYFRLQEHDESAAAFARLQQSSNPADAAVARAYLALIADRQNAERRQEVIEQARALRADLERNDYAPPTIEDRWTSRRLSFAVLPVKPGNSRYAASPEVQDLMPGLLMDALEEKTPMIAVSRDTIGEIVFEQSLSAQMSTNEGQLHLLRLLGARFLLRCEFGAIDGQQFVRLNVVDVETSQAVSTERLTLASNTDAFTLAEQMAESIWTAVDTEYPVRGKIAMLDGKPSLNVGRLAGVEAGMHLALAPEPDPYFRMPSVSAQVAGILEDDTAEVRLTGLTVDQIPEAGLFAFEVIEAQPIP